jgi:GAF domain-containing protein
MKSLTFFGLQILLKGEFRNLSSRVLSLEHDNEEALNYLRVIENSKSEVIPPSTNGKSSEVVKRLSSFQETMAKLIYSNEQTRWHDAGMASFNEILTQNFDSQQALFDRIVSQLAKYVNANQVALFVIEDLKNENSDIRLEACYAYDRKKFTQKIIGRGENLIGQSVLERDTILLTTIPQHYTKITSGLGEATPGCILIAPLRDDKNCIGAIELASFKKFSPEEVRFVESLCKSITASIHNIKQTDILKDLIAKSELAHASVREKEEEIRQQMEELQATNEAMNRKTQELEQMRTTLEKKNEEILVIRQQEKELLEAKLEAQRQTYEMVITRLKQKLQQQ